MAARKSLVSLNYQPIYLARWLGIWFTDLILNGLPRWHSDKESACQCRRCRRPRFNPWIGKIPCSRKWQPTPAYLPGKSHGQRSLAGYSPWVHRQTGLSDFHFTSYMYIYIYIWTILSNYFIYSNKEKHLFVHCTIFKSHYCYSISDIYCSAGCKVWSRPFLKTFIEFVTILLLFYILFLFVWLWDMWDLSFLTRDWTHNPCIGKWS